MKRLMEVFEIFQNREVYFNKISQKEVSKRLIFNQLIVISAFVFIYGLVMGSYLSLTQSLVAGIKLFVLFITTLLICFPSFYVIQLILGSRLKFFQVVIMILSGFVLSSTITLAFAPVVIFFLITGSNYYFLQLLHIAIFCFSGFFGIKLIIDALKYACEKENIYPKTGVTVFSVWVVILAFVGIQLAWNLRPFLGDRGEEFKLFRKYEGNFYTAVIYSIKQLSGKNTESESLPDNKIFTDSLNYEMTDPEEILKELK
jgi:hypothetical protein